MHGILVHGISTLAPYLLLLSTQRIECLDRLSELLRGRGDVEGARALQGRGEALASQLVT